MMRKPKQVLLQAVKDFVVAQGPKSPVTKMALAAHARLRGFTVYISEEGICLARGNQRMILRPEEFVQVPIMLECFDLFFRTMHAQHYGKLDVLDFSKPGLHRYKNSGAAFYFPSVPEDDVMEVYTRCYLPAPGDIVWDAGAHAGATTHFLSQAVGPRGKVFAFEPDDSNYEYLLKNIALHRLSNVIPVRSALDGSSGRAAFQMDGSMSAGIADYLVYARGQAKTVPTLSIPDACTRFRCCPTYIKMDIEGAEVASILGAAEFLRKHAIHFAIESYHRVDGEYTHQILERFFPTIGYQVSSSKCDGQMFTWAMRDDAQALRSQDSEAA